MEDKNQIVEKRVKSTIIRRRKTEVAPEPEAPVVEEVQASQAEAVSQEAEVVPQESQSSESPVAETQSQTTAPKGLKPQINFLNRPVKVALREEKPYEKKTAAPAAPVAAGKEPPRVIPSLTKPAASLTGIVPIIEEETEEQKKARKKGIKKKTGGELEVDLEGVGRVASLTQLTRIIHVDRVFKPSHTYGGKRKKPAARKMQKTQITVSKAIKRVVEMTKTISVGDLAHAMGVKSGEVIKKLMGMGMMATINQSIDFDTASLIAQEFQFEVKDISFNESKFIKAETPEETEGQITRPPVVTVMGHVDHGKTSLLDAIRKTNVTAGEAGGITQHIGAYTVQIPKGKITFLDTPGHEAFTAMRARGAQATDVVILVVAADDGVMPQTVESIDHAKAAGVPIIVAVNKIDKPSANLDRIKRQLADLGLTPEEWGGETMYCLVSAKMGTGVEELLESVILQAEVLELKANPDKKATGLVIESRLDRSRGPLATVLVQEGTLRVGDSIVAGANSGKIRAMVDFAGKPVEVAGPSYAVEIMGLDGVPSPSDIFDVVADDSTAQMIAENRRQQKREDEQKSASRVSLEDFFKKSQGEEVKELNVVVKADVLGSLEAVKESLTKLGTEKVIIRVIHSAVGGINESDVLLASASRAIIIGFNVRPETKAIGVAAHENVDVKLYKIIYEMLQDVKLAMQGLLTPTKKEKYLGRAEVRQAFVVSKVGTIAGSYVIDGKITRASTLRLLRDNVVLFEGKITSLKRFKDDAKEVLNGFECGIGIEGYSDIKSGDVIEAFEIELIQPEL